MKLKIKLLAAAGLAALTAGCGGSGGDPVELAFADYSEIKDAADLAEVNIGFAAGAAATVPFTAGSTTEVALTAVAGNASYVGFVRVNDGVLVNPDELVGALKLDMDFNTDTLTGSANNFYHSTNGAYTGDLSLAGGTIADGGPFPDTLSGDLIGNLTNGGTTYETEILLDGEFQDAFVIGDPFVDAPDAIGGTAVATLDDNGAVDFYDGSFVAQEQ